MKKKFAGTLLATALILTQAAGAVSAASISTPEVPPVTAAPTPTLTPEEQEVEEVKNEIINTVTKEEKKLVTKVEIKGGNYEAKMAVIDTNQPVTKEVVEKATEEVFGYVKETAPQVFNAIVDINLAFSQYQKELSVLTSVVSDVPGVPGLSVDGKDLTKDELKKLHETVKELKKDISKKVDTLIEVSSTNMTEEEKAVVAETLKDKEPSSMPVDFSQVGEGTTDEEGRHHVEIENKNLTDEESFNGTVLVFIDFVNGKTTVVEPEVDFENQTETYVMDTIDGLGIFYADKDAEDLEAE